VAPSAGRTRGVDVCEPDLPLRFAALPETHGELDAVARVWTQELTRLEGSAATELKLKQLSGRYRALHLATHGFLYRRCQPLGAEEPPEAALLRSGLALAGANGKVFARPEQDDGLLTAGEVAALDLTGVEWAVLSACDSGLGAIADGEGVFGLRRAFQIAGVQSLVMSLWPVEDAPTRELMTALYRQRFVDGRLPAEALRQAALEVVAARRSRGDSLHPFYWAPFIVLERGTTTDDGPRRIGGKGPAAGRNRRPGQKSR
jgi:CHAT domain-containing protein